MKVKFLNLLSTAALLGMLAGCSNEDDTLPVNDEVIETKLKVSFTVPTGEQPGLLAPDYAILTIKNEASEDVYSNKKVMVSAASNSFYTDFLEIEAGATYTLESFRVYDEVGNVILAGPKEGFPKGEDVVSALPLTIDARTVQPVLLESEVLPVQSATDTNDFGYEEGDFGIDPEMEYIPIVVTSQVTVGDFLYDSLNSFVRLYGWSDDGNALMVERDLDGSAVITFPTNFDHYKVKWSQWGQIYERELDKGQLFQDKTISLEAAIEARLLKSETEYLLIEGQEKLDNKTDYIYDETRRLSRRDFYYFNEETGELQLSLISWYEYKDERLHTIKRTMGANLYDTHEYFYHPDGRISKIVHSVQGSVMEAVWLYVPGTEKFTGVSYSFDNGGYFSYNYEFSNGNVVREYSTGGSSNNGGASTKFYDDFINPHYLQGITDVFLRSSSRNNVNGMSSSYPGGFPVYVPSEYTYTYSADGYPLERKLKYVGYQNPAIGYTAKTVFGY